MSIQEDFIEAVQSGRNCFLTGGGGVGKTFTVNKMKKVIKKSMITTATTGLASLHVGGTTIHSYSNMGIHNNLADIKTIKRGEKWWKAVERIRAFKIVIIDEISMLAGDQLDLLDLIFKEAKGMHLLPFGGVQMIFVGDFLQLPPVVRESERKQAMDYNYWTFASDAWKCADVKTFNLTEVKRQSEQDTIKALNEIRFGRVGPLTNALFASREGATLDNENEPLRLMPTNKEVDKINTERLIELSGDPIELRGGFTYHNDIVEMEDDYLRTKLYYQMLKNCTAPELLNIKKNSRVIMLKNNPEEGYVNGSMGTFLEHGWYIDTSKLKYENAKDDLISEGIPFESFEDNEERLGQGFPESFNLIGLSKETVDNLADNNFRFGRFTKWSPQEYLLVKLDSDRFVYVVRSKFPYISGDFRNKETNQAEEDVTFHQFPMRLAWAITIHKSQGMTLENVEIHMNRIFSEGQSYVALSRAKSLWGIRLIGWNPSKVMANHDAVNFYNTLLINEPEPELKRIRERLEIDIKQ